MTVAAEALEKQTDSFDWKLTEAQFVQYQLVDDLPEVATVRATERIGAIALLEERRSSQDNRLEASELLPIDALSTADHVLDAERKYGRGSVMHVDRWNGLVQDCQRLVAEWYRKKKPEYFAPLRHSFDPLTETFFSHGLSIRQMTENALVPLPDDPEEEARRVNERVEDATPQILRRLGKIAASSQVVRTISECTDKAISDYAEDVAHGRSHRGYRGYVPEIEKLMVRDIKLSGDDEAGDRFEEQIGLPGTYITHEILQEALRRRNVETAHMSKTELHGAQLLANDDLMEFIELLDTVAGEEWCTNVFVGEEVPSDYVKDYVGFRQDATCRQEGLTDVVETVATFVLDLAANDVDRRKALVMVEEFVKKQLLEIGKQDIVVAEQMFDIQTATGLQEVAYLERTGRYEEAYLLMQEVEALAPGGGYCGAGSCGLEDVNLHDEAGQRLGLRLEARPGDTILRDTVRPCKCGSKTVVYAYNKTKVNKYCETCGMFESKINGQRVG
jgi:hypothetical protein